MDRRVRKTQKAIKTAFLELLKRKEIKEVKVSDICELADINRGTFYLNYLDKYDLLEKVIYESIERLIKECETETGETEQLLTRTFQFIVENKDYYKVLITADKQGLFANYLSQHILGFSATKDPSNTAAAIFISNGIMGVLSYYLSAKDVSKEVLNEIKPIIAKLETNTQVSEDLS